MYLKSIEVQGFKSFANKIVFDFHNGITGIVGPNGSGKSNVSDAVRWVLGEQSAKQLRGASMQDVIFAGTENRKPLSYAYVAITMDNSDHKLAIDFEEVTVSRRVYRSGESEYLINGNPCRLKDVTELFYDTGIGKEGYSIIGQGQIERILNGKPEERRELFDEAAGIVKYKKRKATAQKKLENERENLVRVNDILAELERQVGPLEKQAEKARIYLKKKEELKTYDVNMFLLEVERIEGQLKEVQEKYGIADGQLKDASESYDNIKTEYEKLEQDIEVMEEKITEIRENISNSTVMKGRLENQISVLKEQIHSAELTDEHMQSRIGAIDREKEERIRSRATYQAEKETLDGQLAEIDTRKLAAEEELSAIQKELARCREGIDKGKNELMELLSQNASIKARQQRCDTMAEQINIRKAQLTKRLLARKSEEADLETVLKDYEEELATVNAAIEEGKAKAAEMEESLREWKRKSAETSQKLEEDLAQFHKDESRLESLKNIAERYDGYGNSIRRVMEQKAKHPGLLGVVSDLIQVDKKYETAIETALGGNIQNIVTEDEETAKEMIAFLKQNRFGRATFLPLTSVNGKGNFKNPDALKEKGVIGLANTLVKTEARYEGVTAYLLGRVIVTEKIDDAIALAKKYHYSLHIVTLEGEYLSPGGSMTGGAYRNSSNLLGRRREVEELQKKVQALEKEWKELQLEVDENRKKRNEHRETVVILNEKLQKAYVSQNTARMEIRQMEEKREESKEELTRLQEESAQLDGELKQISREKEQIEEAVKESEKREAQLQEQILGWQKEQEVQRAELEQQNARIEKLHLELANAGQKEEFAGQNLKRIEKEIRNLREEEKEIGQKKRESLDVIAEKEAQIRQIESRIAGTKDHGRDHGRQLQKLQAQKEEKSAAQKTFFTRREELSGQIADLDKENFRLASMQEKLENQKEERISQIWDEYQVTPSEAAAFRNENGMDQKQTRKRIEEIKAAIRQMGNINVNAIEDYKEMSQRHGFLQNQHDDLIKAEKALEEIILELDEGMRKQFRENFARIQVEFDKAFRELFGGGKGTLELVDDEDILEAGIRIISQPPGKKLQNMMQLSGGEKALTAIALLFAIQHLKPSPFCLLDEIEAALDEANVSRYANYLHKLTKNTQFIIITHRRGTMAAADRLYGITMQEKGISALVSVNLIEEALDQ